MSVGRVPHNIDVFETGPTIKADVGQILPEKSETFAEKKDCDEPENNNGDERVAPKKALDEIVCAPAASRQRDCHRRWGGNFSHPSIMPLQQGYRQIPKCYDCVTKCR